jgi:mannobiose 2-epimerase
MEQKILDYLEKRLTKELYQNILPFWMEKTADHENGGFYGRIHNDLTIEKKSPKGLILHSRILWTFSKAYNITKDKAYLTVANRAFEYLQNKFLDKKHGGFYWMVDYKGDIYDDKKRAYGQAFAIYGLSEFYLTTQKEKALEIAKETFFLLEKYVYDKENTGYFETFNRDWTLADDLRLSERDMDEKKSMNNHLHMVEGYANLYKIWKNDLLSKQLRGLIKNFLLHIVNRETMHFRMFFDEKWHPKSNNESYGHDIEGSWLLQECAEILSDETLLPEVKSIALQMARVSRDKHLNNDGAINFELEPTGINQQKHWWVMAEALVGYFNAYQLSGEKDFIYATQKVWKFIEENFVDQKYGEWIYLINENGRVDETLHKVSEWKGPYHNGRACMEILARIHNIKSKD